MYGDTTIVVGKGLPPHNDLEFYVWSNQTCLL